MRMKSPRQLRMAARYHDRGPTISRAKRPAVAALLLLLALPTQAFAQEIELLVLQDDVAPGTGGTFLSFGPPSINDDADVAFKATYALDGTANAQGIFVAEDGVPSEIAIAGDVAPGSGGGLFVGFLDPTINHAGQIAFVGTWTGGTSPPPGVFLYTPEVGLESVAIGGETASGSGGGTFANFQAPLGLTAAGEIIANTGLFGGDFGAALYGLTPSTQRVVVAAGDPAPSPLVGSYFSLFNPGVSPDGDIAFYAFFTTPAFVQSLVHIDDQGAASLVARIGDDAPATGGGTYSGFALDRPGVNDEGRVAFHAAVTGGAVANGLFQRVGLVTSPVVLPGEVAPDTGGLLHGQPVRSPTVDGAGRVAFRNDLAGATGDQGLFSETLGTDEAIAVTGDDAPGVPDSSFDAFPDQPAQSPAGRMAFSATTEGTTVAIGIWTVPEPSPATSILLESLLVTTSARRQRRPAPLDLKPGSPAKTRRRLRISGE